MSSVGNLLSEYRKSRRLSQLDLGLMADVSSRHISFMENGRANPSRDMLLRLADVLDLPLRDSNLLLSAAGFAMTYGNKSLNDEQMLPVKQALEIMIDNHNPYPALVMDSVWNVVMVNEAQRKLLSFLPLSNLIAGDDAVTSINVLKVLFDQTGFRPLLKNWDELAGFLLRRLKKQALAFNRSELNSLLDDLLKMNPPENWQQPPDRQFEGPMVTAKFRLGDQELNVFSTLTHFGTALDVGMEELVIESYFPADEATKNFFKALI